MIEKEIALFCSTKDGGDDFEKKRNDLRFGDEDAQPLLSYSIIMNDTDACSQNRQKKTKNETKPQNK